MNKKLKVTIAIDVCVLALYLAVANPAFTGIGVHEWLGIGLILAFFVHILISMDNLGKASNKAKKDAPRASDNKSGVAKYRRIVNIAMGIALLVVFITATISGLMVSGNVLQTFGLYAEGYFFWHPLHVASAKVLLALIFVHIILHLKWFTAMAFQSKKNKAKLDKQIKIREKNNDIR